MMGTLLEQEPVQVQFHGKPLLSIAIPTYNRACYLRELLECLRPQLEQDEQIELLIADNASTDETPQVVREFALRGLRMSYHRHPINIGADANFLACFEQSSGTYVWIIGDDDIVIPGGIKKVIERLRDHSYDLLHIQSFPLNGHTYPSASEILQETEFTDAAQMIKQVHVNFSFISGNVVNKDRLLELRDADFQGLLNTNLVQLGWICAALNGFRRGLLIRDRLVGARVENSGGYKLTEVFGTRLRQISFDRLRSERLARLMLKGTVQRFWPGMLLTYRRTSSAFDKDPAPARALADAFGDLPRYWICVYPILILPPSIGSAWLFMVRAINWVDRRLGYIL